MGNLSITQKYFNYSERIAVTLFTIWPSKNIVVFRDVIRFLQKLPSAIFVVNLQVKSELNKI